MQTSTTAGVTRECALRASIIITNYNYGCFLRECIESALNQTYPNTEVLVVDDGSTDDSADIIESYNDRLIAIKKSNGGMASAFNAGFAASTGNVVCFLDADDTLFPTAIEQAVNLFEIGGAPQPSKVHWPLRIVDEQGLAMGVYPSSTLPDGDLRECVIRSGETGYVWPMTSGNAWNRAFLSQVFPIPDREYRSSAESYLATLAPAVGPVARLIEPVGTYRMHDRSLSNRKTVSDYIHNSFRHRIALQNGFQRLGIEVDPQQWSPSVDSLEQILLACEEMSTVIPAGSSFIFVEWNQWGPGQIIAGRRAIPFLEREGQYWGLPSDDAIAIQELERLRQSGADFMVFGSPAFWWLEYYSEFHRYLHSRYSRLLENQRILVFGLQAVFSR